MKSFIAFAKKRLTDPYIDTSENRFTFLQKFWLTTRYRLASIRLPVTANEKRLLSYKNKHNGERVFILGNGPSLNQCDLALLKNELTFGVNAIYLNFDRMGFTPTYYVVEDILVAEDRGDEISRLTGPIKFFGNYLNYCIDNSTSTIWLNVQVFYKEYQGFPRFSKNAARVLWVGGTVSYLCLQLAYFMGFKDVYLVGFDHSYTIPKDAIVNGVKLESQSDDPNHFAPQYFGKGYRWHDPRVDRMELAYWRAKEAFEADGRYIFNATLGGCLEVFKRVDYATLF